MSYCYYKADCRTAECHYTGCRGAPENVSFITQEIIWNKCQYYLFVSFKSHTGKKVLWYKLSQTVFKYLSARVMLKNDHKSYKMHKFGQCLPALLSAYVHVMLGQKRKKVKCKNEVKNAVVSHSKSKPAAVA